MIFVHRGNPPDALLQSAPIVPFRGDGSNEGKEHFAPQGLLQNWKCKQKQGLTRSFRSPQLRKKETKSRNWAFFQQNAKAAFVYGTKCKNLTASSALYKGKRQVLLYSIISTSGG